MIVIQTEDDTIKCVSDPPAKKDAATNLRVVSVVLDANAAAKTEMSLI